MLGFFPTPYPDELLYSVIARYYVQSANSGPRALIIDLFGKERFGANFDFPSHIESLVQNLPIGTKHTAENFIRQNTLYPFYAPFWQPDKSKTIFDLMLGEKFGDIHQRSGVLQNSLPRITFFRFCSECLSEDIEKYGETYWRRLHQITGVYVCLIHRVWLRNSTVTASADNPSEFNAADEDNCVSESDIANSSKETFDKLINLAEDVNLVLNKSFPSQNSSWFKKQYQSSLIKKGLANVSGKIHRKKLVSEFFNFYGEEFLQMVYSEISSESIKTWVGNITGKQTKNFNPIRHLLFIRFLGEDISTIFEGVKDPEEKPFGSRPWTCFNPASEHYLKKVITSYLAKYSYDLKKVIGTFFCSCGFIYSTSNYDLPSSDNLKPTKIEAYGKIWEEKLKQLLVQDKITYREAGKRLNMSISAIHRYAIRLNIVDTKKDVVKKQTDIPIKDNSKLKEQQRALWLNTQKNHPTFSKTDLSKKVPAVFSWLYKHDRKWLNKNSPKRRQSIRTKSRIDWITRDKETLISVKKAVEFIRKQTPPVKISINSIGRHSNLSALLKNQLQNIPNTKNFLFSQVETTDQFQIRRIHWGATELASTSKFVSRNRLSRFVSLRRCSDKVRQEIAQVVSEINSEV